MLSIPLTRELFGSQLAGWTLALILGLAAATTSSAAELQPKTLQAWELYVRLTEKRIASELDDGQRFLVMSFDKMGKPESLRALLRSGQLQIQKRKTLAENGKEVEIEDGMIHHWIGTIFIPDVRLDSLIRWVQDYDRHQDFFQEVEKSQLLSRNGDTFQIYFRLRRKKIITVVYNTYHTAVYRRQDPRRVSSHSFTTKIVELEEPGAPQEKEKPVGNDRGFLWRLNSYWRFQEEDNGVYVECESVSLSRAIPFGFGWLLRGYVESVPRESLENTLASIRNGIQKSQ